MVSLKRAGSWIVKRILLILISAATFFNTPVLSTLVLCLGQDGHLALEYSVNGRCGTSSGAPLEAALHASEHESHCGTCTDVSLIGSAEESFRPAPALDGHLLVGFPAPESLPASYLEKSTLGLLPRPPPTGNPHLAHLRTVRLLV
jgi:hypothetical protein